MPVTQPAPTEREEAVIISGPRKGSIITLPPDNQFPAQKEEALLDLLSQAFQEISHGTRAAVDEAQSLVLELREARSHR
jgi:hypothetical protein